ncbi:hypothetical protein NP493_6718g00000 [Ridgeia piscesae]|uniref:Chitin-binding type-4 domain-containing protein n=1 Tax=Ridgeia piscesae TaxID=27915 RepID=A0AAD9IRT0_RIDPI|nr:hypothetical protein NP493_6718g00000 [Ridgeia piscesae]
MYLTLVHTQLGVSLLQYQNGLNGGKCGVCGDPWGKPNPQFVAGGKYANGIITRTYKEGQEIAVAVDVTAPHGGWFEFRICPNNDFRVPVTHECLNKNLLPLADGTGYRVYLDIKQPAGFKNATLRNNWGTGEDGRSCIGCGLQEEFYGCADVEIVAHPVTLQAATGEPSNRTPPSAAKTTQPPSSRPANSLPPKEERPTIQPPIWLPDVVTNSPAKPWVPEVVATSPAKPWVPDVVTASPAKPQLPTVAAKDCGVVDGYEDNKILDRWCQVNCPGLPGRLCRCGGKKSWAPVCGRVLSGTPACVDVPADVGRGGFLGRVLRCTLYANTLRFMDKSSFRYTPVKTMADAQCDLCFGRQLDPDSPPVTTTRLSF